MNGISEYHERQKPVSHRARDASDSFIITGQLESEDHRFEPDSSGRDAAIAAYEMGIAKTLDTSELETQQQELLSEMEVLNGMIQQMIRQNATIAQDQTEYNQRFDSLSQKFKEAEANKDAFAQQISDIRDRRGTMEDFLRILKQQDGEVTAFSEKRCLLVDLYDGFAF